MKRTIVDRLIGLFSPSAEMRRLRSRGQIEALARSYDAAQSFRTDDWRSATRGSANAEIRSAQATLRAKARDAVRNSPYAGRALTSIVANTIGPGIVPHIKGRTKLQTKRISDAWQEWGESTICDSTGKQNFYGLQAMAFRGVVESGEIIAIKEIDANHGMSIRILESDYIASNRDSGNPLTKEPNTTIQGVKLDERGRVFSYYLYESHPGDLIGTLNVIEVPASKVAHVFRPERPGQVRGVSWFHPVLRQIEDFTQLQEAMLISRKIAACFSAFITTNDTDSTLSSADLAEKRQNDWALEPAAVRYLGNGEDIKLSTPPMPEGYDDYAKQTLRSIAAGIGISYEALTTDYSNVNFSSGRMGHMEFRRNVDMWRWGVIIPQFCEPMFEHFKLWCSVVKGIDTSGVTVDWVEPAWTVIDPAKEYDAMVTAIRAGLTSQPRALRELGFDPDRILSEIAESNTRLDELEITLDTDPRKITKAGLMQVSGTSDSSNLGDTTSEQDSQKVAPDGGDSVPS